MSHAAKIVEILLVNFVLSGDNALVIALVAMRLDAPKRRRAILYGTAMSVALRAWLTLSAGRVLGYPYLQGVGGLLLSYLACSLLLAKKENAAPARAGSVAPGIIATVAAITLADVTMSLDNVIALAGIARGDRAMLIIGLLLSISLIMSASNAMARVLSQSRLLQALGTAALAWTAGGMVGHDPAVEAYFGPFSYVPVIGAFVISLVAIRLQNKLRKTWIVWFARRRGAIRQVSRTCSR